MRKSNRLRLQILEAESKYYGARLAILECDHEVVAVKHDMLTMCVEWPSSRWQLKCSKCGKVTRDITEREYLEMKLESDKNSFLGRDEAMKARLAALVAEDAAETSS